MDGLHVQEQVEALGHHLAGLAEEVRQVGAVVRAATGVQWESTAAQRFRGRLAQEAEGIRVSARTVDDAADAVLAHAREVRR